jgi:hypothetical protein
MVGLDGVEGQRERERDGKYVRFSCSELGMLYWMVIIMSFSLLIYLLSMSGVNCKHHDFFQNFVFDDLSLVCWPHFLFSTLKTKFILFSFFSSWHTLGKEGG